MRRERKNMKLRAPSVPLITVDPYFSVWSPADRLTDKTVCHWTGKPNSMLGLVNVDGKIFRFMGVSDDAPAEQISLDIDALSTTYVFEAGMVRIKAFFLTPLLPDDPDLVSRPVSYLKLTYESVDSAKHSVGFTVSVSEEICLDKAGQSPVVASEADISGIPCMRMGNSEQNVLNRSGDDVRIDWGYFYLAAKGKGASVTAGKTKYASDDGKKTELTSLTASAEGEALIMFAYDDINSIIYFGKKLSSWWNRDGMTIEMAIEKAESSYDRLVKRCREFSDKLYIDACRAGGEQYAELLSLAYRQVFAAHKTACDEDGQLLFVSKECFSNGCAATVDVSYPSIPMFLHYNPEFVKGMMRPIFRFAASENWPYDFAPHDAGRYPILNGQYYGEKDGKHPMEMQMPVEECGNMLIMAASVAVAQGNTSFIREHIDVLEQWAKYLIEYGQDPENQLCTDDFAGHLAHNCNLSLKAIMGLAGLSIIFRMLGAKRKAESYLKKAREMARVWLDTAKNGDGSYRLAFDREGTFSLKYNAVWDKLFGTGIFPAEAIQSELASYFRHVNPYGMPLDNRALYTKSDWIVWTATMFESDDDFRRFIEPVWRTYDRSPSRVPMNDWYDSVTSLMEHFQHRSVQGGLFIKLMEKDFREKSRKVLLK